MGQLQVATKSGTRLMEVEFRLGLMERLFVLIPRRRDTVHESVLMAIAPISTIPARLCK
jgi:hypothetical protein